MPAAFQFGAPVAQQIHANGQDVLDVLMYNWGVNVKDAYPPILASDGVTALDSPGFPFTPQAITIGPRSTIDRAFVAWNYQAKTSVQTRTVVRVVSIDAPLLWPQTAGVGHISSTDSDPLIARAQFNNLLYVTPHVFPTGVTEAASPGSGVQEGYMSTLLPEQILKADGTAEDFYQQGGDASVLLPILHLQFHLKPGSIVQPIRRFPYVNGFRQAILDPNVEELMTGWPIYGRKSIGLQVSSSIAGTTFRIAALRNVNRNYRIQETTEGEQTSTAADESLRFRFCDLAADYLLLYATAPNGASRTVSATIQAYD